MTGECFWKQLLVWSSIAITFSMADNLALLSDTLRTYEKVACDEEWMTLRCPIGTTMSIQKAQYGHFGFTVCSPSFFPKLAAIDDSLYNTTCTLSTAIQTVVGLCQKKTSCKFQTSQKTFGWDPCPGRRKYVEVAYICRPSEFKSVIGCENEVIQLKCNRSSRIAIYSANFGRTEYESIQCPQPKGVKEETCLSSYATETVMQMCHGKRVCALGVDPATFGNPCKPESTMYLKLIHTCVPRTVLQEKYQGDIEPDEMLFEDDQDTDEGTEPILEQPSIYAPDHSKGFSGIAHKTTPKPIQTHFSQHPDNRERLYLYVAVGIACGLLILVFLLLFKIWIHGNGSACSRSTEVEGTGSIPAVRESFQPSSSSVAHLTSAVSDMDNLSSLQEFNDACGGNDLVDLQSMLRSSPTETILPLYFAHENTNESKTFPRNIIRRQPDGNEMHCLTQVP